MKKPRKQSFFSLFFNILIDFALIGMGVVLYIHFLVYPLGPVGLSPIVVNLFGSLKTAVLVISGAPVLVGVFNLFGSFLRAAKNTFTPRPSMKAEM
jgi:hypothetical protein